MGLRRTGFASSALGPSPHEQASEQLMASSMSLRKALEVLGYLLGFGRMMVTGIVHLIVVGPLEVDVGFTILVDLLDLVNFDFS